MQLYMQLRSGHRYITTSSHAISQLLSVVTTQLRQRVHANVYVHILLTYINACAKLQACTSLFFNVAFRMAPCHARQFSSQRRALCLPHFRNQPTLVLVCCVAPLSEMKCELEIFQNKKNIYILNHGSRFSGFVWPSLVEHNSLPNTRAGG